MVKCFTSNDIKITHHILKAIMKQKSKFALLKQIIKQSNEENKKCEKVGNKINAKKYIFPKNEIKLQKREVLSLDGAFSSRNRRKKFQQTKIFFF